MGTSAIVKVYDIRGTYLDQISGAMARAVGSAFATFVASPRIVVARETRPLSPALSEAFSDGVRALGVEVVDLGWASTDMLYFATGYLDTPGAMFSASHNPAQYNGIKLCHSGA